jgi:hypothetical protein
VSGVAPIQVVSGTSTPVVSIAAASGSAAGSMSSADFTKLAGIAPGATANAGTVTSVTGGAGLTGAVTTSGALAVGAGTGIAVAADSVAIDRTVTDTWYAPIGGGGSPIITTAQTVHVQVAGNDTTGDGLTVGTAFATLQRAIDSLVGVEIASTGSVLIQLGAGDFQASGTVFSHPNGGRISIAGKPAIGAVTGIVQATFVDPLVPVPGVRGASDLHNTSGMLPTSANTATRTAAIAVDGANNLALLRTIYPTRLIGVAGSPVLTAVGGVLGDLRDLLLIGGAPGLVIDRSNVTCTTSLAVADAVELSIMVRSNSSFIAPRIISSRGSGIRVDNDSQAVLDRIYVQGASVEGINATRQAKIVVSEVIITGGLSRGLSVLTSSELISQQTGGLPRSISCTGNASSGIYVQHGGRIDFSRTGASGNFINARGNVNNQIGIFDAATFTNAFGFSVSLQGSPTQSALRIGNNSTVSIRSPLDITGGNRAIDVTQSSVFLPQVTITDPVEQGILADASSVELASIAFTGGFGSIRAVSAINGAQILDRGTGLSTLAGTNPTAFLPLFRAFDSLGSVILGGPSTQTGMPTLPVATTLEMQTGTETALRAMSPALVRDAVGTGGGGSGPVAIQVAVSNTVSPLTTGTGRVTFRMPFAMAVTQVRASVSTAPTGANLIVNIRAAGVSILSTLLSINAGQTTSLTATVPPVISTPTLVDDAQMTIDITQIGSTVAGVGLVVTLLGIRS